MKRLFLTCVLLLLTTFGYADEFDSLVASVSNPRELNGSWVTDPTGVIASRWNEINQLSQAFEKETSIEIATVVLPTIGKHNPKDFAVALLKRWGVGKKGKDNGVLILHVLDQRRIDIEVGYGLEGSLPDLKVHWIAQEIATPLFKKSLFADGHYQALRAITLAISNPDLGHDALIEQANAQPIRGTAAAPTTTPETTNTEQVATAPNVGKRSGPDFPTVIFAAFFALNAVLWHGAIALINWIRMRGKHAYVRYQIAGGKLRLLQYGTPLPLAVASYLLTSSIVFSALLLFGMIYVVRARQRTALDSLRNAQRVCSCGKTMRKLNEKEDDKYLNKGMLAEERIHSVDYDVWLCSCGQTTIEPYRGASSAQLCTHCNYRTNLRSFRTLVEATTGSTGRDEVTNRCANCDAKESHIDITPRLSDSGQSSGGSSSYSTSSSASSSFGGGSSGGGGAGASY